MPVGASLAVGSAVVGGLSANAAKGEAKKARNAAIAENEKTRAIAAPYVNSGTDALGTISDPNRMMAAFKTDPGYQFRLDQGINALNTNKAAAGLTRSGSTLKDTVAFGQGMATSEYDKVYNRLFDRAQMGLQGVGVTAGVNTANAGAQTNYGTDAGNAALAMGNSVNTGLGMGARYAQGGYGPAPAPVPAPTSSSYVPPPVSPR